LLIVFTSFASSTASGIWMQFLFSEFAILLVIVFALLVIGFGFMILVSRRVGLSREDEAAAVFCGSTKSLANGAPIAQILFAGSPFLGVILLPILLYHQFQLVICAILAQRYSKLADESAPA
ncbi:MAG: bile acid:sodium symporter, partial [Pseudomonadota bacterium]